MLLILTSENDLAADYLIAHLHQRGRPYFRMNSEDVATAGLCFSSNNDGIAERIIEIHDQRLDLTQVSAVWYRRTIHPSPVKGATAAERHFNAGELRHLTFGMVWNPSVLWVNPIDRVYVAEHKIYQLQIAKHLGFIVPRTLVSNDLRALREFTRSNLSGTICKPIFHGLLAEANTHYAAFTRRIGEEELDDSATQECPILLQEEVTRISDVRVTIIGEACFVADMRGRKGLVDWRVPDEDIVYEPGAIDSGTEAKCRALLKSLGLFYGAFDFIRTPEGQLIFLEVNPTGEWAWLEQALAFPMRSAFERLFYGEIIA